MWQSLVRVAVAVGSPRDCRRRANPALPDGDDVRRIGLAFVGLWLSLSASAAWAVVNSCADPYWSATLRCQFFPAQVPQPVPAAPQLPGDLRDYTRVELNDDPAVRCADGTRPIVYVDPAQGGPSNRWLISLTGGGSCSAQDLDQNGSFESGQACAETYADSGENAEMGTASKPAMKNLGTTATSDGIMSPDLLTNPVFARFNRVRIEKCSYDRYSGRAVHLGVTASAPGGAAISFNLHQQGQKIVLMALEALRGQGSGGNGLSYTTYVTNAGSVQTAVVTLPSMADATQVVFIGHSGGAHGLYHNADRYAQRLRSWPAFAGDVRVIHDANFMPAAETEASFDVMQPAGLFSQTYAGNTAELGPYDAASFYSQSPYTEQARAWLEQPTDGLETLFDASCVAAHQASGDTYKCRDRGHERLHHESTPAFLREDFSDPNGEHTNGGVGFLVTWGPLDSYVHCTFVGFSPCPPMFRVAGVNPPYRARLASQAAQYLSGILTASELATGADPSGPLTPTTYLWMPDCRAHESAYDEIQYQDSRLVKGSTTTTMRQMLEQFVAAPASGVVVGRVDGMNGDASECGPRLGANGFE